MKILSTQGENKIKENTTGQKEPQSLNDLKTSLNHQQITRMSQARIKYLFYFKKKLYIFILRETAQVCKFKWGRGSQAGSTLSVGAQCRGFNS